MHTQQVLTRLALSSQVLPQHDDQAGKQQGNGGQGARNSSTVRAVPAILQAMDVDLPSGARAIVLVEGISDKAALETLAERRGIAIGGAAIRIVAMGGVTNLGWYIDALNIEPRGGISLTGLCDAAEEDYVRDTLARTGFARARSRAELSANGFYVSDADLEDELIRAVGVAEVVQIIKAQGEFGSFRTFGKQPAQQGRTPEQHLHRFMGTRSGRKSQYARLLAHAVDLARIPEPLDRLLTHSLTAARRGRVHVSRNASSPPGR